MSYATRSDLVVYGLPATALGALSTAQQDAALSAASERVDGYYRGRYSLPLVSWDTETRAACCRIAAYELLNTRGYSPAAGADVNIKTRYDETIAWLKAVQRRAAHPAVVEAEQDTKHKRPVIRSSSCVDVASGRTAANRGW
jgi:phage gp36-like protein